MWMDHSASDNTAQATSPGAGSSHVIVRIASTPSGDTPHSPLQIPSPGPAPPGLEPLDYIVPPAEAALLAVWCHAARDQGQPVLCNRSRATLRATCSVLRHFAPITELRNVQLGQRPDDNGPASQHPLPAYLHGSWPRTWPVDPLPLQQLQQGLVRLGPQLRAMRVQLHLGGVRQLQQLLQAGSFPAALERLELEYDHKWDGGQASSLGTALASRLPNLRQLSLKIDCPQPGLLTPLSLLTGLSSLTVDMGWSRDVVAAAAELSSLTQLTSLAARVRLPDTWVDCKSFSLSWLATLTQLRCLTLGLSDRCGRHFLENIPRLTPNDMDGTSDLATLTALPCLTHVTLKTVDCYHLIMPLVTHLPHLEHLAVPGSLFGKVTTALCDVSEDRLARLVVEFRGKVELPDDIPTLSLSRVRQLILGDVATRYVFYPKFYQDLPTTTCTYYPLPSLEEAVAEKVWQLEVAAERLAQLGGEAGSGNRTLVLEQLPPGMSLATFLPALHHLSKLSRPSLELDLGYRQDLEAVCSCLADVIPNLHTLSLVNFHSLAGLTQLTALRTLQLVKAGHRDAAPDYWTQFWFSAQTWQELFQVQQITRLEFQVRGGYCYCHFGLLPDLTQGSGELTSLKALSLDGVHWSSREWHTLLHAAPGLETLGATTCQIRLWSGSMDAKPEDPGLLRGVSERLAQVTCRQARLWSQLTPMTTRMHLNCKLQPQKAIPEIIMALQPLSTTSTTISQPSSSSSSAAAAAAAAAVMQPSLTVLKLTDIKMFTPAAATALQRALPHLRQLVFSHCAVDPRAIVQLRHLHQLVHVTFSDCGDVEPPSCLAVQKLRQSCPRLQVEVRGIYRTEVYAQLSQQIFKYWQRQVEGVEGNENVAVVERHINHLPTVLADVLQVCDNLIHWFRSTSSDLLALIRMC